MRGAWRTRQDDDRPHGLNGWGTEQTPGGSRVVWAALGWT